MAETGSPSRHATTVTSNTTVQTNLRFDPTYVRTFPGILKCIQPVACLLVFILIQATPYSLDTVGSALSVIAMVGFWCTLILLLFYTFHVIEKLYRIPWLKFEMVYCLVLAVLFLIMSPLAIEINNALMKTSGVSNLLAFIFIEASGALSYQGVGSALNGISMFGFWCTLILLIFYLFHIIEKFYKIPWIKFEMVYCLVMAILFLIVSPLALQFNNIFYQIGAVFGFISMVVYAIDAFLKFRAFRSGRLAQGERVVTKTTTTY